MELILWRHAEPEDAAPGQADARRQLTTHGHKQARRMAHWLNAHLPESTEILVSPAVRTQQTVESLGRRYRTVAELGSGAEPETLLEAANWPWSHRPVLVVGHQPTLGQVAALLLSGRAAHWPVRRAQVWWFCQTDPEDVRTLFLRAVVGPELLSNGP